MTANPDVTIKTVLVTGAAGFIGREVCRRLAADGYDVRAGIRNQKLPPDILSCGVIREVYLDLDKGDPDSAVRGVDAIVHTAFGSNDKVIEQTARLLDAASRNGCRIFVYFSSIAVYGGLEGEIPEERAETATDRTAYGEAKWQAEAKVNAWYRNDSANRAIILRPGIVYGVDSPLWNMRIRRRCDADLWGRFVSCEDGLVPLVHVRDVARAVALTFALNGTDGNEDTVFNIVNPSIMKWNDFFVLVAGRPLPTISRLGGIVSCYHTVLSKIATKLGVSTLRKRADGPTFAELRRFERRAVYSADRARTNLSWQPEITVEDGVRL